MENTNNNPPTDNPTQEGEGGGGGGRGRGKPLSNDERNAILQALLALTDSQNRLNHGAIRKVARKKNVSPLTVSNIWKRGIASLEGGATAMVVASRRQQCGRKKIDRTAELQALAAAPRYRKDTIRSAAAASGIPRSTFHRLATSRQGVRKINVRAKPVLTAQQKLDRIRYCTDHLDLERNLFKTNMDVVHVDEKWFYLKQVKKSYYLTDAEPDPQINIRNKRYIEKVMFLCAVARPRWDTTRNQHFDGKIGIWPFVETVPAARTSRNRPAGTPLMKSINVTADRYKEMIMDKVIPAINSKWPACHRNMIVRLQQDNATPHHQISMDNIQYTHAQAQGMLNGGMMVVPENQPANSPDLNVLDLGYFNSIQSLQHKKNTNNIEELVAAVLQSFLELDRHTLNKVFLSHQQVMTQILLHDGGNDYKLPHMKKNSLARSGQLPVSITITDELRAKIEANEAQIEQEPGAPPNLDDALGEMEEGQPPEEV